MDYYLYRLTSGRDPPSLPLLLLWGSHVLGRQRNRRSDQGMWLATIMGNGILAWEGF